MASGHEELHEQLPEGGGTPLGRLLVDAGLLTPAVLDEVLEKQARTGRRLGEILVDDGYVSSRVIANALAEQHGGMLRTEYGVALGLKVAQAEGLLMSEPPATPDAPEDDAAATPPATPPRPAASERPPLFKTPVPVEEPAATEEQPAAPAVEIEVFPFELPPSALERVDEVAERLASAHADLDAARAGEKRMAEAVAEAEARARAADARAAQVEGELAELRRALTALEAERAAEEPGDKAPASSALQDRHLLFVPGQGGYTLRNANGPAPAVGDQVELDGDRFAVVAAILIQI